MPLPGLASIGGVTGRLKLAIDDAGLHYSVNGQARTLPVDTVVLCTGQDSQRALDDALRERGVPTTRIGGCDVASELDAQRAIAQATQLAYRL